MRTTATLLLAIFLFACNTVKKNSRVHIETKDSTVVTEAKKETLTVSDSVYKKNSDSSWSREIEIDYDTASFSPSMSPAWDGTATTATATWGLRSRVKTVRIKERGTRSVTDSGQTVRFNASSVVKKDSVQVKGHLNTVEKQKQTSRPGIIVLLSLVVIVVAVIVVFVVKRTLKR